MVGLWTRENFSCDLYRGVFVTRAGVNPFRLGLIESQLSKSLKQCSFPEARAASVGKSLLDCIGLPWIWISLLEITWPCEESCRWDFFSHPQHPSWWPWALTCIPNRIGLPLQGFFSTCRLHVQLASMSWTELSCTGFEKSNNQMAN